VTRARLLIVVLAVAAIGCLAIVLSGQYASGNVYAEYSSQRTDRMGTAALYEALAKTWPDVARNDIPIASLTVKNAEVLVLGLAPSDLETEYLDAVQALAKNGNRVVIALDGGGYVFDLKRTNAALEEKWHVRLVDSRDENKLDARNAFSFEPAKDSEWKAEGDTAVSRQFGKGSMVLIGSSWPFTNEALREDRDIDGIEWTIGNPSRILFDETHLGTEERGTVMGLARRFRLQGVLAVAILCALLFIWQASTPFPPERATPADVDMRLVAAAPSDMRLTAASASQGLRNLLAQNIPAGRIVSVCVAEWRRDRGRLVAADKMARIEAIAARTAHPVMQWREIRAELDLKRKPK
jgi:hypothetical protein